MKIKDSLCFRKYSSRVSYSSRARTVAAMESVFGPTIITTTAKSSSPKSSTLAPSSLFTPQGRCSLCWWSKSSKKLILFFCGPLASSTAQCHVKKHAKVPLLLFLSSNLSKQFMVLNIQHYKLEANHS